MLLGIALLVVESAAVPTGFGTGFPTGLRDGLAFHELGSFFGSEERPLVVVDDGATIDFHCELAFFDSSYQVTDDLVIGVLSSEVTSIDLETAIPSRMKRSRPSPRTVLRSRCSMSVAARFSHLGELAIVANCPKLTRLNAFNCRITALPTDIGDRLPNLEYLDLASNKLTSLPRSIVKLTKLKELELHGNPLQTPPLEIALKGLDAIRAYFEELDKGSSISKLLKVLIIGNGYAGKTSLRNAFAGRSNPHAKFRTVHADIEKVSLNQHLVLNIYDFGGQKEYLAGQLPYITKLALYLLVVEARYAADEYFEKKLERFLVLLLARAPDAVVLLVVSKVDEVSGDPELLCRWFESKVADWLEEKRRAAAYHGNGINSLRVQPRALPVSVDRPDTIQRLRDEIVKLTEQKPPLLPSVGQRIPTSYEMVLTLFGAILEFGDDELALQAIRDGTKSKKLIKYKKIKQNEKQKAKELGEAISPKGSYRPKDKLLELWRRCCDEALFDPLLIDDPDGIFDVAMELWEAQGLIFIDAGIVYLRPLFVVDVVSALVDHRLKGEVESDDKRLRSEVMRFVQISWNLDDANMGKLVGQILDELRRFVERGEIVTRLLLSYLWRGLGFAKEHHSQVLEMLAASGVLFTLESNPSIAAVDVLAVVPFRLPLEPNATFIAKYWPGSPDVRQSELHLTFRLFPGCPAGLEESFASAVHRFGRVLSAWASGVVVRTASGALVRSERIHIDIVLKVRFDSRNGAAAVCNLMLNATAKLDWERKNRFTVLAYDARLRCPECREEWNIPAAKLLWEPHRTGFDCAHSLRDLGLVTPGVDDGKRDDTNDEARVATAEGSFSRRTVYVTTFVCVVCLLLFLWRSFAVFDRHRKPTVLIVTTATTEMEAVLDRLENLQGYRNDIDGYPVTIGKLGGRVVAVCKTGQGINATYSVVLDLLRSDDLKDSVNLVFAVGFAWGARPVSQGGDQHIGDVIVGTKCFAAGPIKASNSGDEIRGTVQESSLKNTVNEMLCKDWPRESQSHFGPKKIPVHPRRPRVLIGTVISRPELIDHEETARRLITHPQIVPHRPIGGEMELYQIIEAASATGKPWLLAKAICDFAGLDGPKTDDHQALAAAAAADFAEWLMREDVIHSYFDRNKRE